MSEEVLALKFRPRNFSQVIGQESTTKDLQAALAKGSLSHALVFSGTRGTGKTTTARIVAKALNCEKASDKSTEPCNECHSCTTINAGKNSAVLEIDAASNNGVDDVRAVIEKAHYSTLGDGKNRIIILDEAHMLSKNAFNALLKTLEEPPKNVYFILATTEYSKLPATIRSRCVLYSFLEVGVSVLTEHYEKILSSEGNNVPREVIEGIAIRANGSVRDGLSLLERASVSSEAKDTSKLYFRLVGSIYANDVVAALEEVENLTKEEDAKSIIQNLQKWFYWCSLENFGQKTPIRNYFTSGKMDFDLMRLQKLFDTCLEVERNLSYTPNSKTVISMGILRACL